MSEHLEQALFFARCKKHNIEPIYAIPNGGHRHIAVAAKLKAEGVKRGIPDIHYPVANGKYHGLWIEMKTKTGRVTKDQKRMIEILRKLNHRVEVCRSCDEAWQALKNYQKGVV